MGLGTAWAQAVECTKRHDGCSQAGVGFGTEPADFLDIQARTYGMPADGLVGGSGDDLGTSEATLGMQFELERGIVLGQGPDTDLEGKIDTVPERELETGPEEELDIVPEHEIGT